MSFHRRWQLYAAYATRTQYTPPSNVISLEAYRMSHGRPTPSSPPPIAYPIRSIANGVLRDANSRLIGLPLYVETAVACMNLVHEMAGASVGEHAWESVGRAQKIMRDAT